MQMRPPLSGGLISFFARQFWSAIVCVLRPATAVVLVILLLLIAVAGIIQLTSILSPPG